MAIEGNDWWVIAGVAAGGLVAGAFGANLTKAEEQTFTGLRRWYKSSMPIKERVKRTFAGVWQRKDEFWVRISTWEEPKYTAIRNEDEFLYLLAHGAPYEAELGSFSSFEEAMKNADIVLIDRYGKTPITEWGYPSDKIELEV